MWRNHGRALAGATGYSAWQAPSSYYNNKHKEYKDYKYKVCTACGAWAYNFKAGTDCKKCGTKWSKPPGAGRGGVQKEGKPGDDPEALGEQPGEKVVAKAEPPQELLQQYADFAEKLEEYDLTAYGGKLNLPKDIRSQGSKAKEAAKERDPETREEAQQKCVAERKHRDALTKKCTDGEAALQAVQEEADGAATKFAEQVQKWRKYLDDVKAEKEESQQKIVRFDRLADQMRELPPHQAPQVGAGSGGAASAVPEKGTRRRSNGRP